MNHKKRFRLRRAAALAGAAVLLLTSGVATQEPPVQRPITLREAVGLALEQNRELQTAQLGVAESEGQVREAWSQVFPQVDLTSTYTRNLEVPTQLLPALIFDPNAGPDELIPIRFGSDNLWYGQIRAEQPLFRAAAFIGVGAAGKFRALQAEEARGTAHQVATRVRTTYYNVLLAEEAERLNAESVRRVQQTLDDTRALYRAGMVSEYDVLRLEVELTNLETELRRAENAAEAARRTLAVELGMDGDQQVTTVGSLATMQLPPEEIDAAAPDTDAAAEIDPANQQLLEFTGIERPVTAGAEELVTRAHETRSDLLQLDLSRSLRKAELRAEQAEYLPRIDLFGSYAVSAQQDGGVDFFGNSDRRFYDRQIGVQVTMPLFTGFSRPARVQQKRAILRQVETQQRQADAQIENTIRTLLDSVREARERAEAQRKAVDQAQRGYDIARAQFREGIGSQLEVTDAEVTLRQTEFNYAEAIHDYLVTRAQLDEAVGVVPGV